MRTIAAFLLMVGAACGIGSQAVAQACTSPSCQSFVEIEDGNGVLVYRSHDLSSGSSTVRHLVFVVHGSGRNAYGVFSNILTAADAVGKLAETLVVSPLFKTSEDAPGANDLYWTADGWKSGEESHGAGVSSFEIIDRIADLVVKGGLFPNLELVTIVGHSAGGQFTQRYAAGNETQQAYANLKFNYVVMNPSSYMYLNPYRPVNGTVDRFAIPSGCSDYDEYKYGLVARNAYMNRLRAADLISQYLPRHVTYLVGGDDTSRTNDLDLSCAGEAQGYTRLERGLAHSNHLHKYYPDNNHAVGVVPGVGHSSLQMSNSAEGKLAIFPDPRTIPETNPGPMPPGTLQFVRASDTVAENGGIRNIQVTRAGGSSGAASVSYQLSDVTATAGADYSAVSSGTLTWTNNDPAPTKSIPITVIDDAQPEGAERLEVSLSAASGAMLGTASTHTLTITDDDATQAGTVQFTVSTASTAEAAGTVTVNVSRVGGAAGAASVQYQTANGTATAPADYAAASGTLSWLVGDGSPKPIIVTITNDTTDEPDRTFTIALSNASGAAIGAPFTATLTIIDDDEAQPPQGGGGDGGGGRLDLLTTLAAVLALALAIPATSRHRNPAF